MDSGKTTFAVTAASAGLAACSAEFLTIPLDSAKVRMQLSTAASGQKKLGMFGTLKNMVKNEGLTAPYRGLVAGFHRQLLFGTLRISLYQPIRDKYCELFKVDHRDAKNIPLSIRILSGITSGASAMMIANPTDLAKVRIQGNIRKSLSSGTGKPIQNPGIFSIYSTILREEGVRGLYVGLIPNLLRNSIINASELVAYDVFKSVALKRGYEDSVSLHLIGGLFAGITAVICGSPVDVLKTRIMNTNKNESNGIAHHVKAIMKNEGPLAFYKGFLPNVARIGSFNAIVFVLFEQYRKMLA